MTSFLYYVLIALVIAVVALLLAIIPAAVRRMRLTNELRFEEIRLAKARRNREEAGAKKERSEDLLAQSRRNLANARLSREEAEDRLSKARRKVDR